MSNNTSNEYFCDNTTQIPSEVVEFNPTWVLSPPMTAYYGYQAVKLYNQYHNSLTPTDILHITEMFDRTGIFFMNTVSAVGAFIPRGSWLCRFLSYLRLTFVWSAISNFIAAEVDSYLRVKHGENYRDKMTTVTAAKIAHGATFGPLVLGIIFGFSYPQYFDCQPEKIFFQRIDNILVVGIPSLIAILVNLVVTGYISGKLIKKIKQLSPHGPVSQAVKYNVETDRVFVRVSPRIPTISQPAQNQDLVIEDFESTQVETEDRNVDDPDQIEVLQETLENQEMTTEVRRQNSAHDMFYKVDVPVKTIMCYPIKESTYEDIVNILKLNIITICNIILLSSNHLLALYFYLVNPEDESVKMIIVMPLISVLIYPFIISRKLAEIHSLNRENQSQQNT